jgi:hypothetical protein
MWVTGQPGKDERTTPGEVKSQEKLDRALVAGLILEVVLDQEELPAAPQARQRQVKTRIQDYLVRHLAGSVSLDRFRALAQNLDDWFDFYYPLLVADGKTPAATAATVTYCAREPQTAYHVHEPRQDWQAARPPAAAPAPAHHAILDQLLDTWLEGAKTDIPHRSHRKLTPGKLRNFLRQSAGRWFRLRDFERFVQMDRKTAWDYLQQFLHTGLLCHNRKNSAAVRYCLAPSFLKVEADALRLALSLSLSAYPEDLVEKVSDFLIATGGESFPVQEWEQEFPASKNATLMDDVVESRIAVWQNLATGSRFLKLHHRWLQKQPQPCFAQDQMPLLYGASSPDFAPV